MKIYPVLLAGGSGTRLWPLSRKSYPKQFSKLIGETTLFQKSIKRLITTDVVEFAQHVTITNADFRFIVEEQFSELGIAPGSVLIEPEPKNTAAAVLASSIFALKNSQDPILLVTPSDHEIPDIFDFHQAINAGLIHAKNGKMVTFGVKPTYPETGFGYLELMATSLDSFGTSNILKFVEKPDLQNAEKMLVAGNFLWNAGIFLFRAADMIDAFKAYAPKTLDLVSKAVQDAAPDLGFLRLAAEPWHMLDNVSVDHAIMEKAQNLVAVPYRSKWSDLGGWDAVWSENNSDKSGNVTSKTAHAIGCRNSLLRSEDNSQQLVGLGLEDIIAIAMPDAVLVAHRNQTQNVNKTVELLKTKGISQAEVFPKDHRPWGWFESLVIGEKFQVKRIHVKAGAALSLQSHDHRSEHWIVVSGTARVTIRDEVKLVTEGQSVYVPLGAKHRLENPCDLPMVLIEVQIGTYLGEDDIIRYDDLYARN